MPQSLSSMFVHLIFSTKHRQPLITEAIDIDLYKYMSGIFENFGSPVLAIGGYIDHIHVLFLLSRVHTVAGIVRDVKVSSSIWMKEQTRDFKNFHWQAGYGAFTIGESGVSGLKRYIANQHKHHQQASFQDEYRVICRKYNVEIDERYVWD